MKAISLWQPWATAIAIGSKRIETRHWSTQYRGPLVIHAAKRCSRREMIEYADDENWVAALFAAGVRPGMAPESFMACLPFGALVATCTLVDCRPIESFGPEIHARRRWVALDGPEYWWSESLMGNFEPARFGWVLEDVRPLEAISYTGGQGFFNVPDEILRERAISESAF